MSVQAITYVLDHSEAKGSDRLVLIALANHACTEKGECWPSVRLLAREARVSERTVQYALRSLEHSKRIKRLKTPGQNGTVRRRLVFDPSTEKSRPALPKEGGADHAPPAEAHGTARGADPAPGADSAGVQPATVGGANDDAQGVQTSAPEPSKGTVREPSAAANAAAAGASAPGASSAAAAGSSSIEDLPPSTPVIWPAVRAALIAGGFPAEGVDEQRPEISRDGRRLKARLVDVDWTAAGEQLAEDRRSGRCYAETPLSAFRYLAKQLGTQHKVATAQPQPAAPHGERRQPTTGSAVHLQFPAPTEEAVDAWRALVEQFEQVDNADSHASYIDAIRPLQVDGATLEITAPAHCSAWIQRFILPALTTIARRGRADVRWIDPATVGTRHGVAA